MAFELEALVGHLYIVGGRPINVNPPGALVVVAPPDAARGRVGDTFFTLIVPSGTIAPTTFYEQLAVLAAERYFNTGGSVTIAMRTMFQALNRNLYEHNQEHSEHEQQQFEASAIVVVLHGDDMYVARVGPVVSVLQTVGLTLTFPDDFTQEEPLFSAPLGIAAEPEVAMVRYGVDAGSRLVLADANLCEIPVDQLSSTLLEDDIEQVLDGLRAAIKVQGQLMLVELLPPNSESPVPAAPGESSLEVNAKLNEARLQIEGAGSSRPARRKRGLGAVLRWGLTRLARRGAAFLQGISRLFQRFLPLPEPGSDRNPAAGSMALGVLLIPLFIVAVVVFSWVSNTGESEFEQCLQRLQETASLARSMDNSNRRSITSAWNAALQVVDVCDNMRPDDPVIEAMRQEAQEIVDNLNNVQRRVAKPLTNFQDASIARLRLKGADMYALDTKNHLVYHIKISDDGTEVERQEPVPNMRRGATVDGFSIGQIVDIAFDDVTGELAMIDENGTLVRCRPQFIMICNAQRILGVEQWEQPSALTVWGRRLYILDSAGGQIWKYDPSGASYPSAPREYFTRDARPNLRKVVDFTISQSGDVYVLYDDGIMKRYNAGEERAFAFSGFNEGSELYTAMTEGFFLNDSPFAPAFFVISRGTRAVYETTLAGTFMDSYQALEQDKFELLSAIVAYPIHDIIYVASGNSIFRLHKDANA